MSEGTRTDSHSARVDYNKARNKVKRMMRQAKRQHENGIGFQAKSNSKAFWSHVRKRLKTKSGVAPLLENNKDLESTRFDDKEKANIVQKQFSSIFTREPDNDIPKLDKRTDASITDLFVTEKMVKIKILMLDITNHVDQMTYIHEF